MKRRIVFLMVAAAMLLACQVVQGQTRPTKSKTAFEVDSLPQQLGRKLLGKTTDKNKIAENAKFVEQFAAVYDHLDGKHQQQVTDLYNAATKTKMELNPDFENLTRTLMAYSATKVSATLFDEWLKAMTAVMDLTSKKKEILGFITLSDNMLADRTMFKSKSSIWRVQPGAVYSFEVLKNDIRIRFSGKVDLTYASGTSNHADENTLHATSGEYYYLAEAWEGKGGRLTWERCGVGAGVCYADLKDYSVDAKLPKFAADSVTFINETYFKTPIKGVVEDALSSKTEPDKYSFPKFRSYQKDFQLKDVLPGVDFEGNFMMHGPRFVTNDEKNPASMIFYRGGKRFLVLSSTKFAVLPHMLTSERAMVKMYIGDDSICNAGVLVRYTTADKRVNMINSTKRNYYSPYTDSYHQLDIYCENINWLIDKDVVEFNMVAQNNTQTFVTFESNRFYSLQKSREVQGIEEVSPVVRVYKYMKAHDMKQDFSLGTFQRAIGMDEGQTKLMVHGLSKQGLVSYDEGTRRIHVHDKLIGFYKAIVKQQGHDYDALTLQSETKSNNAELDLRTLDLNVHGIEKFVVSDSQLVVVKPYQGDIVVRRNRDIFFSGFINVGRFEYNVSNAAFYYDDFRFDLPQIDSVRFYVANFQDTSKLQMVRTPLYNLVGDIQVDKPDNHCGLKKNKDYPIFNSVQPSYVYYDRNFIFNGVYNRDRFYYSLHPFVIKQLTDFKTDSLEFVGVLTSAGIFPDIEEPLKVQRDYSLGFVHKIPSGGYPAYGGKGQYYKEIDLSYRGLRGQGALEYLTSTAITDKYLFMPDSMMAQTDTFYVKPEQDYPDARNGKTLIRWYPYQDSMTVSQLRNGTPFIMYGGITRLAGRLTLQPKGASGYGTASLFEGTLQSKHFDMKTMEMNAAHTDFHLKSTKYDKEAFAANNMRSHVDYEEKTGQFNSNDTLSRTLLPALGYAAWVDQYTWSWERKDLALDNSKSMETLGTEALTLRERAKRLNKMPGARFESTDPKLKDIHFCAINSRYQYDNLELSNHNVYALPIADALIAPAGDSLHISSGGVMSQIKGGELLFPRDSAYHLFYNCDLMVKNGQQYGGSGTIDYISQDEKKQPILMTQIAPDATGMSVANGVVPDSSNFTLNEAFGFAGKVKIDAAHKDFFFDGGVRLLHKCAPVDQLGLLAYANYLDPENIRVEVPEKAVDWKGHPISASVRMSQTGLKPTSGFLTKPQTGGADLMSSFGLLHYDAASSTYTLTSQEKLDDNEFVDRYLKLNTDNCVLEGEGPITFGLEDGMPVKINAYGTVYLDPQNESDFAMNTIFGITLPMDNGIISQMAKQIEADLRPAPADRDNDLLDRALLFSMGDPDGELAYQTYRSTGAFDKLNGFLDNTILLEGLRWQYSVVQGYHASGTVALCNVGKQQLHVNVKARAQLFKRGSETYLVLYLQVANDHWYYFKYEYKSHHLSVSSSVGEWNDKILAIKKDKRTMDGFSYSVTNSRNEVQNFLSNFTGESADREEEEDYDE
ncbi:MAG: hypothetical protein MJZ67_04285 [Bacteroidales bacterium]|nr:hypothetical protein [Bacteroidales bacterium]